MAAVRSWFPKARVRIVHVIDSRAFERLRDAGCRMRRSRKSGSNRTGR